MLKFAFIKLLHFLYKKEGNFGSFFTYILCRVKIWQCKRAKSKQFWKPLLFLHWAKFLTLKKIKAKN